jgi:F-type H+-transporting ATPase subunit epsilon
VDVTILTPDKKLFVGTAERLSAPGTDGEFEVLNDHAPMVSSLGVGVVVVTTSARETTNVEISGGFIEVLDNKVSMLVQQGTTPLQNDSYDDEEYED